MNDEIHVQLGAGKVAILDSGEGERGMERYKHEFQKRLKEVRKKQQPPLTQQGLADKMGKNLNSVFNYENRKLPSVESLLRLADILHVSIDYLFGRDREYMINYEVDYKDVYQSPSNSLTLGMLARQIIGMDASAQGEDEADTPNLNIDKLRSFLDQYYRYKQTVSDIADPNALDDMYSVWLKHELEELDEIPLEN